MIELSNVGFRLGPQPNRTIDRTIKNKICLGHFTECLIRSSIRKEVLDYRIVGPSMTKHKEKTSLNQSLFTIMLDLGFNSKRSTRLKMFARFG